jgi:hypothetical protein
MIYMSELNDHCIPEIEMRHILDPLDTDNGPLQRLALRAPAGTPRETPQAAVSGAAGSSPVHG